MKSAVEQMPARIRMLPLDPVRNIPVPWFVAWIDGKPEFRVADAHKHVQAIREKRCWVCGDVLGRNRTFVLGPMCGVNRTSAEPPCHIECALYSALNCPFLTRPRMDRREGGLEALPNLKDGPGFAIKRNPGVALLWTTRTDSLFGDGKGGILFDVGDPTAVDWYAEGRRATRAEVEESVRTGLPALEELARTQEGAMEQLRRQVTALEAHYPEL